MTAGLSQASESNHTLAVRAIRGSDNRYTAENDMTGTRCTPLLDTAAFRNHTTGTGNSSFSFQPYDFILLLRFLLSRPPDVGPGLSSGPGGAKSGFRSCDDENLQDTSLATTDYTLNRIHART